ncbi:WD40 repeat-like protein [Xylariaceae sp. FL1019]|nr:WD40 repeat-like protein [Xylariaceae sp. FL1019]
MLPIPGNLASRQSSPSQRNSTTSILRSWRRMRRAASVGSVGNRSDQTAESVKGSLGLNLLFEPSEPRVDLVFVHGLQGGSRKTWSFNPSDPSSYWPMEWLPLEPGFRHARIHSFGYDSDWKRPSASTLTIHDFAVALLADLRHAPALKRNGNTPIILLAHSMGGLVIKKAYLLALRNDIYKNIASRVHTMFFLGTPHRGSDSAAYLQVYLSLPFPTGVKSYVKELMPDSQTVHDINYDFRFSCGNLRLNSFFESQPTAGIMIVEKQSAVIGLPNEEEQYLPADHRHLCKFVSDQDPSYLIITRKLLATIEDILKNHESEYQEKYQNQLAVISHAFDSAQRPDSDLYAVQTPLRYHDGSCQWLTEDPEFSSWLSFESGYDGTPLMEDWHAMPKLFPSHRFLWLHGPPGSGKSIAAGHAIKYLHTSNFDVSYFFFKTGSKSTIASLLLSLAYQMAETSFEIRLGLFAIINSGRVIDSKDYTMIWNTLFLGCIFKRQFHQPQYWVIDALDECLGETFPTLVQMLTRIDRGIPIKILFTSRPESKIRQIFEQENIGYFDFKTAGSGSFEDISAYVQSRPKLQGDVDSQDLVSLILEKSDGIFLWASLMMDRLEDCYSIEDMEAVVKGVPSEMNDFYAEILEKIQQSTNAELAKTILKWVISAPRPLTINELREAIKLDIKRTLLVTDAHSALGQICRNFVTVNSDEEVQVMHQTVKTYLTSKDSSFYISKRQAHEDIALVCLDYLNGNSFLPRTNRRFHGTGTPASAFDLYAVFNFAYHLENARSISRSLLSALQRFMDVRTLVWVERVAETGKLAPMISVIQCLKKYLSRLLEASHPLDNSLQAIGSWINDLTRLVTNFGLNLVDSPPSIYLAIPSLCPSSSILHKAYAGRLKQRVICSSNENWDERSSCILFQSDAKSVVAGPQYLAIGLVRGQIRIYDQFTLELVDELKHEGPVRQLAFGNVSGMLVSGSPRNIAVWSSEHRQLWTASIPGILFSVNFSPDDTTVFATIQGELDRLIIAYKSIDGTTIGFMENEDETADSDSDDNTKSRVRHIPQVAQMSPLLGLAAIAYRNSHLALFQIDTAANKMARIGAFVKEGSEDLEVVSQVLDVVFCPATEYKSMAVLYQDGDLVTVELNHHDHATQRDVHHIFARVLAASPDGRTLAAGENTGAISLFNFETLQLIHRVTYDSIVAGIAFAPNGLCFYDIRGRSCNIWEPPSLVRSDQWDDGGSSQAEENQQETKVVGVSRTVNQKKVITCLIQAGDDPSVFCGREDGSVTIHNTNSGDVALELKDHKTSIHHLAWSHRLQILYSVDTASRCIATRLFMTKGGQWRKVEYLFDHKVSDRVKQAVAKQDELAALIVTESEVQVWESGAFTSHRILLGSGVWISHPTDPNYLMLMKEKAIQLYHWGGLRRADSGAGISITIPGSFASSFSSSNYWSSRGTGLLAQSVSLDSDVKTALLTLDTSMLPSSVTGAIHQLPCEIRVLIGIFGTKVFFLTRRGWVCSCNVKSISDGKQYSRHFFVPPFWRTGNELMMHVVSKNHLALVYRDELIILQRFLDLDEKISLGQAT